jgi:hypothetical protein
MNTVAGLREHGVHKQNLLRAIAETQDGGGGKVMRGNERERYIGLTAGDVVDVVIMSALDRAGSYSDIESDLEYTINQLQAARAALCSGVEVETLLVGEI